MIFKKIFLNVDNPINKIKVIISKVYPNYEISETKENRMSYASCTIRRHEKGRKVPLHKDNVTYEGIEYNVSKIDNQISCILHLQETERGGTKMPQRIWRLHSSTTSEAKRTRAVRRSSLVKCSSTLFRPWRSSPVEPTGLMIC